MALPEHELLEFLCSGPIFLDALLDAAAKQWQISASEIHILLFLLLCPHLDTARDVAEHCGMSKASVSGNVLKLTGRGLLTVDVDLKDRRFQHLTPTEQAQPVMDSIRQLLSNFCDRLLQPLTEQERVQFLSLLSRINQNALPIAESEN